MPQNSAIFGVARIRCHEKDLIGKDKMQRLCDSTADEAVRLLNDMGYGSMPDATAKDVEKLISNELNAAYALVREVTFDKELSDLFLMKADVHNLKLLLKLRLTGSKDDPAYMQGGCYAPEALYKMVQNSEYRDLPEEFRKALATLEQSFQADVDPAAISIMLDKAYMAYAMRVGKGFAVPYFKAQADFANILALLRIRNMNGGIDKLKNALIPGGDIPESRFVQALEAPVDGLGKLIATGAAREHILKGLDAIIKGGSIVNMEKERDNYIISMASKDKYQNDTMAPVIGYLLAREQEARCVRLILTAKRNNLPESAVTERLRELYG